MAAHPLDDYRPAEGEGRELTEDERRTIDQDWQGGVENLGFLFELGEQIALAQLGAELVGFAVAVRGGDPKPSLVRSSHYDANLPFMQRKEPGLLLDEIGAVIGEAAVELGFHWRHDGVAPYVIAPEGEAFQPFAFARALLAGEAAEAEVAEVFAALRASGAGAQPH